jgi:hypothetical protein
MLLLAHGKPTAPQENFIHQQGYINRDKMTNTYNSHVWSFDNPHTFTETHFWSHFSVNIWCVVNGSQIVELFVLEEHLTSECYLLSPGR